jgi:hypothetical protein
MNPEIRETRLNWLRACWYKVIINGERFNPTTTDYAFVWTLADIVDRKPEGPKLQFLADYERLGWAHVADAIALCLSRVDSLHLSLETLQATSKVTRHQHPLRGDGMLTLLSYSGQTTRIPVPVLVNTIPCAQVMDAIHAAVQLLTWDRQSLSVYMARPLPVPARDTEVGRQYIYARFDLKGGLGEELKKVTLCFNTLQKCSPR